MRNAVIIKYLPRSVSPVSPDEDTLSSSAEVLPAPDDGSASREVTPEASVSVSGSVPEDDSVTVSAGCVSGTVVSDAEVSGVCVVVGSVFGGSVTGGFVVGGFVTGGFVAGGSVTSGSVVGGSVVGGSVAGGSVSGGCVVSGVSVLPTKDSSAEAIASAILSNSASSFAFSASLLMKASSMSIAGIEVLRRTEKFACFTPRL